MSSCSLQSLSSSSEEVSGILGKSSSGSCKLSISLSELSIFDGDGAGSGAEDEGPGDDGGEAACEITGEAVGEDWGDDSRSSSGKSRLLLILGLNPNPRAPP